MHHPRRFAALLAERVVDVAIGPVPADAAGGLSADPVPQLPDRGGRRHRPPAGRHRPPPDQLREQTWLLGPSAASRRRCSAALLRRLEIPEDRQRIFQSHAAALEEARRDNGVAVALASAAADDLTSGRLAQLNGRGLSASGLWTAMTLPRAQPWSRRPPS